MATALTRVHENVLIVCAITRRALVKKLIESVRDIIEPLAILPKEPICFPRTVVRHSSVVQDSLVERPRSPTMVISSDETSRSACIPKEKLKGYDFYKSIGSPKRVVAPMVDQSEAAFRMLSRKYGAELCYTPMFHSRLFIERPLYRQKMKDFTPLDRPLIVQFCGNDPDVMLAAARMVENDCDAVDVNLGCPQGIAKKGNYGSYLLENPGKIKRIVRTLHENLRVPVTCKIRILPDRKATFELCTMLVDAGCQLLVVHGRTRAEKKQFTGECDWDIIRHIKELLPIPVIANGGIENMEDFSDCLKHTGADGAMISEAILERPAFFTSGLCPTTASLLSQEYLALEFLEHAKRYNPDFFKAARAHLFKILYEPLNGMPDLRDMMAETSDLEDMTLVVKKVLERSGGTYLSVRSRNGWYRRHRAKRLEPDARESLLLRKISDGDLLCGSLTSLFGEN